MFKINKFKIMSEKNEILKKELISEKEYNVKLALCSGHAIKYAFGSFFVGNYFYLFIYDI